MATGNGEPELTYRVSYTEALREVRSELTDTRRVLGSIQEDLRHVLEENKELKTRVRALELRFYGILAGIITAIGVILYQSGGLGS